MTAFIFPGQGSQKVGMGVELAEASAYAREVFEEVDDALNQKLSGLMKDGPESELTLTSNAQPAIMANSIATLRVLEKEFGVSLAEKAECVAGHSLGEYSALCATGAFDLSRTAKLLRLRGIAMQDAVPIGVGAMAALLGADIEKATALAEAAAEGQVCEVANDNDPTQVVISGHAEAIDRAIELAKDHGIKRGIKLPVSAPFHCSLMEPAAQRMKMALSDPAPGAFMVPLYANVTAARVTDPAEEQGLLVDQITGRVRWRESVLAMRKDGVERFVELGAKVLGPMVDRIDKEAMTISLVTMEDLEKFAKEYA
ncbi:ACP S-malonyltransferase [Qipengyuania huizhouensis]|uniref:ACP S-malonyltransferase n=1 Tax=Qipengyuania huizhouensis TaxID=2867245 RepID=UPI00183D6EA9|nr:ACP S-malonyltransferase [Qipengyuania huizhouensis]MBA4764448.1 ACP S-malonyltransferase [Erythrobacter sp.]MBX7461297.1 ACP S-malonyltransferase [Qipengyuania huizhouensis]